MYVVQCTLKHNGCFENKKDSKIVAVNIKRHLCYPFTSTIVSIVGS